LAKLADLNNPLGYVIDIYLANVIVGILLQTHAINSGETSLDVNEEYL